MQLFEFQKWSDLPKCLSEETIQECSLQMLSSKAVTEMHFSMYLFAPAVKLFEKFLSIAIVSFFSNLLTTDVKELFVSLFFSRITTFVEHLSRAASGFWSFGEILMENCKIIRKVPCLQPIILLRTNFTLDVSLRSFQNVQNNCQEQSI